MQAQEGDEVKIGQVVATIEEGAMAPAAASPAPNKIAPAPEAAPQATVEARAQNLAESEGTNGQGSDGLPLSPPAAPPDGRGKRFARRDHRHRKGGRATKGDVLGVLENRQAAPAPAPSAAPATLAAAPKPATAPAGRTTRRKLSPLRRKIAAQLVMAQQTAAILTTFNECDMSGVMALRSKMQDAFTRNTASSWVSCRSSSRRRSRR